MVDAMSNSADDLVVKGTSTVGTHLVCCLSRSIRPSDISLRGEAVIGDAPGCACDVDDF
jgi:hypothetical protein